MRTTLDLDDDLVNALGNRYPGLTRTEAVESAIREYLRMSAVQQLRDRAGTFQIEDVSQDLRDIDTHT